MTHPGTEARLAAIEAILSQHASLLEGLVAVTQMPHGTGTPYTQHGSPPPRPSGPPHLVPK